jgi:exopolyphosphatase / guanosine-5'-triphosphate,3'-diphosphate pyrophosphatase
MAREQRVGQRSNEDLVAAVDLGSNSFHMVYGHVASGQVVIVGRMKEMVQLGAGLDERRMLTEAAQERGLQCLERFGQRTRDMPERNVRVVGTNTLRVARNAASFLEQAEQALGQHIEIISGIEEARLIYAGVIRDREPSDEKRLVVDIGGGSTELVIGQGERPLDLESLYVGSVSLMQRHFSDGRIDARRFRRAEVTALRELERVRERFRRSSWDVAIGASGTVRAVARVLLENGFAERGITRQSVARLREAVIGAGHVEQLSLEGLSSPRATVFPGGLAVLSAVLESLGVDAMELSHNALREGLLGELVGRFTHHDVRDETVDAMVQRYRADVEQARRVEATVLGLLDQVAEAWDLPLARSRELCRWAARLHEIGLDIAHSHYHKHSAYVVENGDMSGFSRQEQRMLAALVRAHRRKFPSGVVKAMTKSSRLVEHLAVLLRLAVLLHRGRTEIGEVALSASRRALELAFAPGWLEAHPLVFGDLLEEAEYLHSAGFELVVPALQHGNSFVR